MWKKTKQKNCQRENSYIIEFDNHDCMHSIWVNLAIVFGHPKKLESYECEEIQHEAFTLRWFHAETKFQLILTDQYTSNIEDQLHIIFDNNEGQAAA